MRRTLAVVILAAAAAAAVPTCGTAQQLPAHVEEGLFEVLVPALGAITVPVLVDTAQAVLLPLEPVLSHLGFLVETGPLQAAWRPAAAAPESRLQLTPPHYRDVDGDTLSLPPSSVLRYGGEVFVSTAALGVLLGAEIEVDWGALRVVLTRRDPPFPAHARALVEARRSRLARPERGAGAPSVPYTPRTGGGILDWSLGTSPLEDRTLARVALGAAILGGDLVVGGSVVTGDSPDRAGEVSYRRIFPERRWINQLLLGQVVTQDLAPRSIMGAVVSNIPQQRDAHFSDVAIAPDIPEGWEFEVYQGGRLVGFSSAGADEAVLVPVRYGQTPVEVRMVGPSGEEVVSQYRYLVPITHLPPGRTEYSAGVGVCPADRCDGIGYGELRHGWGQRLTLGGGVQALSEDGELRVRPSALASFAPDRHWALEMEARAEEFVRASVDRMGDDGRHVGVDASLHQSIFGQPSFLPGSGARWQLQGQAGAHPVHVTGRIDGVAGDGIERVRLAAGRSLPRGFGELAVEGGPFGADRVTGRATTILPERLWAFGRPIAVSGSMSATADGLRLLELSSSMRPRRESYLSAALQWNGERDELHLKVTFRQVLQAARLDAALSQRSANSSLTMSANGSIAIGGVRGSHFSSRDLQRRAGVVGRVYYDRNGNRAFDDGEQPAPDVSVLVGGMRTRTDDDGLYRAWNVTPYEVTAVSVDTLSGIDPRYTVLTGGTLLRPVPHLPNRVDFPLTETRELLGRVQRENGKGVGGVEIEILSAHGDPVQTLRTFTDGTFYVSRLLPGDWRVRIASRSLRALGVASAPPEVTVHIRLQESEPLLEIPPFVLREDAEP